jgi:hypothetical protein
MSGPADAPAHGLDASSEIHSRGSTRAQGREAGRDGVAPGRAAANLTGGGVAARQEKPA